jgi:hypothetical protein
MKIPVAFRIEYSLRLLCAERFTMKLISTDLSILGIFPTRCYVLELVVRYKRSPIAKLIQYYAPWFDTLRYQFKGKKLLSKKKYISYEFGILGEINLLYTNWDLIHAALKQLFWDFHAGFCSWTCQSYFGGICALVQIILLPYFAFNCFYPFVHYSDGICKQMQNQLMELWSYPKALRFHLML